MRDPVWFKDVASDGLVVGFDLDMTLADTRPGIGEVWRALAERTGVPIDVETVISRLGPPLEAEAANWFPPEQVAGAVATYRELYPSMGVPAAELLPGVREAIDAVHRNGGRVLVVTAKNEPHARLHMEHFGLPIDEVIGDLWAEQKGVALRERGAEIYVGDHLGDVRGARAAGAVAVSVTTGPISASEFAEAGTDVVLDDLTGFPAWLERWLLPRRLSALEAQLKELGSVLVAFSGGADSAFLLAAAVRALGPDQVVAATAVSPSLPDAELAPAREFAASLGVRHLAPSTNEMARDGYRANAGDRCYFCKSELLDVLTPLAEELGIDHVATGTNYDDARAGFRPGIRAAHERGAVTPLRAAGFTKSQVRTASRQWELPTWNKPAAACLSSRIAYGLSITPMRLVRVERAEAALREVFDSVRLPVQNMRVRDVGDTAKVEVDSALVEQVTELPEVYEAVAAAGFDSVEVDPKGFRSGSMNELLTDPERYR
ncbi:hypothetical protein GCM10027569_23330 [Flindersiella endophytica]